MPSFPGRDPLWARQTALPTGCRRCDIGSSHTLNIRDSGTGAPTKNRFRHPREDGGSFYRETRQEWCAHRDAQDNGSLEPDTHPQVHPKGGGVAVPHRNFCGGRYRCAGRQIAAAKAGRSGTDVLETKERRRRPSPSVSRIGAGAFRKRAQHGVWRRCRIGRQPTIRASSRERGETDLLPRWGGVDELGIEPRT